MPYGKENIRERKKGKNKEKRNKELNGKYTQKHLRIKEVLLAKKKK